ncbi:MAG: response regulator [Chitinophagaceae bacterium]|nr:MAG: response regulator [Chitinophagaceae bacterium]
MTRTSYIILADDDHDDRSFVEEALFRNSFNGKIKPAENGLELMHYLEELVHGNDDSNNFPDLILLDLNMPLKDGYEVMQEIKQHPHLKNIPVLVLTSSLREYDEKRCMQLGCTKFFQKPLTVSEYDRLARSILRYMNGLQVSC